MKETRYLISETAKLVQVEPHVLRYWKRNWACPSNEMRWDIDTTPIKIWKYFRKSRN